MSIYLTVSISIYLSLSLSLSLSLPIYIYIYIYMSNGACGSDNKQHTSFRGPEMVEQTRVS